MGIFHLLLIELLILALTYAAVWLRQRFLPKSPIQADYILWGIGLLAMVLYALSAFGLWPPHDVKVPQAT